VSQDKPKNLAASVRQRLLSLSRERGEVFDLVLTLYALERFLYRIGKSKHADRFVLKGAMLFACWTGQAHRPTRDLDLLGYGDASAEGLRAVFQEVCRTKVEPDGLRFDAADIRASEIREDQEYHGQRVELWAFLGKARIKLQVDVGFGDSVTPEAEEIDYPTLLDLPAPRIRAYPKETVVAEKLQAMVALGMFNSRMKDFYDIWVMSKRFSFDGQALTEAIRSTFARRRTEMPAGTPTPLSDEFAGDTDRAAQWRAFLARSGLLANDGLGLREVIVELRRFLMGPVAAVAREETFKLSWPAGGPWTG